MAFRKPNTILSPLLNQWKSLLQQWAKGGSLVTAAQEALLLSGIPEGLQILIDEWAAADFNSLPEVELLSAADISGAMGAYAISTGKIYLNADWVTTATQEGINAVLTEELGHHLDGLLNRSDTPGDEGQLFAASLTSNFDVKGNKKDALQAETDHGTAILFGSEIAIERSNNSNIPVILKSLEMIPIVFSGQSKVSSQSHSGSEFRNRDSFAAIQSNGQVITWGGYSAEYNKDLDFDGPSNNLLVTQIYSNEDAFAALRNDGSVLTWGAVGGNSDDVDFDGAFNNLTVKKIFSTKQSFSALRSDGSIVSWGLNGISDQCKTIDYNGANDNLYIIDVFSTANLFGALRNDGSFVIWGGPQVIYLDNCPIISSSDSFFLSSNLRLIGAEELKEEYDYISQIILKRLPFPDHYRNTNLKVDSPVSSTKGAFAAITPNGKVITLGDVRYGADPKNLDFDGVFDNLKAISMCSSNTGFAALLSDGSIRTWASGFISGEDTAKYVQIISNDEAFAALTTNGEITTWGDSNHGGIGFITNLPAGMLGTTANPYVNGISQDIKLKKLYSNKKAFAALRSDGSVASWGDSRYGGDSRNIDFDGLNNNLFVIEIYTSDYGFSAIRNDGSVVAWGMLKSGWNKSIILDKAKVLAIANPFTEDNLYFINPAPSVKITASQPVINEGETVDFSIQVSHTVSGQALYYSLYGANFTKNDVALGASEGLLEIMENNSSKLTIEIARDQLSEGSEYIQCLLFSDSDREVLIGSAAVEIRDTSLSAVPAYSSKKLKLSILSNVNYAYWKNVNLDSFPDGSMVLSGSFAGKINVGSFPISSLDSVDEYVAKINSNGSIDWVEVIGGGGVGPYSKTNDIASFNDGSCIVLVQGSEKRYFARHGSQTIEIPGNDSSIIKLRTDGSFDWSIGLGGGYASKVLVNPDGTILVYGDYFDSLIYNRSKKILDTTESSKVFVMKINQDGSYVWAKTIPGSTYYRETTGLGLLPDGGCLITGNYSGELKFDNVTYRSNNRWNMHDETDIYIAKYNSLGDYVWANQIDATTGFARSTAITTLPDGSAIVVGAFHGRLKFDNYELQSDKGSIFIARIGSDGKFKWATQPTGYQSKYSSDISYEVLVASLGDGSFIIRAPGFVTKILPNGEFGYVADGNILNYPYISYPSDLVGISENFLIQASMREGGLELEKFQIDANKIVASNDLDPWYSLSSNTSRVVEGELFKCNISALNVLPDTKVFYALSGINISINDFEGFPLTGSLGLDANGVGSFQCMLSNDFATEGDEILEISIYADSQLKVLLSKPLQILVRDNSLDVLYTVGFKSPKFIEGSYLLFDIITKDVAPGTPLYFSLSGTGITAADFSVGALTGSGIVGTDGKISIRHTIANDLTTEGAETLDIKLFSDSTRSTQVGSTASVSISDTSITPAPTYTLTPSSATINEGAVLTSTVATTNLATGTAIYYALSGTGITTADFSAGALTGEGSTDATGKFTFTHTLANDLTTEDAETLSINLYSDSARTLQVGATASVSIVDSSIKSKSFNLDVDGDGKITALGDGLMVIRKLFGAAFAGDVLTNKAISPTATRTTAEIHQFIESGISTGTLDVDKDGKTTALGDGLMVIRHLFGAAFAGEALTNKAISPASPYFGTPANFAAVATNIDSMRPI